MMNEQNPPPYHLTNAESYRRIQTGILITCLAILLYLLVVLDTGNILSLLLIFLFVALPVTFAFFFVDKEIRYWEKPYRLYSQEFSYRPRLQSEIYIPIEVEYQFPTTANTPDTLQRINAAALAGINKAFSSRSVATDYEETRRIFVDALTPEIEVLGLEVFRIQILKIYVPSSQQRFSLEASFNSEVLSIASRKLMAGKAH